MSSTDDAGFVEKHIEKIVLGAGLLFLLIVAIRVFTSPPTVELAAAPKLGVTDLPYSLRDADQALLKMAKKLPEVASDAPVPAIKEISLPTPSYRLPTGLLGFDVWGSPRPKLEVPHRVRVELAVKDLLPLATVDAPLVKFTRELLVKPQIAAGAPVVAGGAQVVYEEVTAVHGAAVLNFGKMMKKWQEVLATRRLRARLTFLNVEVQRRHALGGGGWSEPIVISRVTSDPEPLPLLPSYDEKKFTELQDLLAKWRDTQVQTSVMELPYWDMLVGGAVTSWMTNKPRTAVTALLEVPIAEEGTTTGVTSGGTDMADRAARVERANRLRDLITKGDQAMARGQARQAISYFEQASRLDPSNSMVRTRLQVAYAKLSSEQSRPSDTGRGAGRGRLEGILGRHPGAGADRGTVARTPDRTLPRVPLFPWQERLVEGVGPVVTSDVPPLLEQLGHPRGIAEVWFHDVDLADGQTYQYRLRVTLLNPLFAQLTVVAKDNQADAAQVALVTDFSPWSAPVTAERPTRFYLVGSGGDRVAVDVFTVKWGLDVKERFTLRRGEQIGGKRMVWLIKPGSGVEQEVEVDFATGAVGVDFAFNRRRIVPGSGLLRSTTELFYLEVDEQLKIRNMATDRQCPEYKELLQNVQAAAPLSNQSVVKPAVPDRRVPDMLRPRRVPGTEGRQDPGGF